MFVGRLSATANILPFVPRIHVYVTYIAYKRLIGFLHRIYNGKLINECSRNVHTDSVTIDRAIITRNIQ
jgi:hypothetical protein